MIWVRNGIACTTFLTCLAFSVSNAGAAGVSTPGEIANSRLPVRHVLKSDFDAAELYFQERFNNYLEQKRWDTERLLITGFARMAGPYPELRDRLDTWVYSFPDSYAAYLSRARYFIDRAWDARGTSYVSEISDERLQIMRDLLSRAKRDLEETIRLEPGITIAYDHLILIAAMQGDSELVKTAAARGLEQDPTSLAIFKRLIWALSPEWGGSIAQMQEIADLAISRSATNPELGKAQVIVETKKASRLVDAGKPEEALRLLEAMPEELSGGRRYALTMASVFEALDEPDRAIEWYLKEVERRLPDSSSRLPSSDMGEVLLRENRYDEAIKLYSDHLKSAPYDSLLLANRARVYMTTFDAAAKAKDAVTARRESQKALADLDRALLFKSLDSWVRGLKATIYYKLGVYGLSAEWKELEALGLRILELNPRSADGARFAFYGKYFQLDCDCIEYLETWLRRCEAGMTGAACRGDYLKDGYYRVYAFMLEAVHCPKIFTEPVNYVRAFLYWQRWK